MINLSKFYLEESKSNIEEQIKNIEKNIIDLDIIKEEIISEIDKLKKSNDLEMKFYKKLINTFKYEESQNNLNYNVIQNLELLMKYLEYIKFKYLKKYLKKEKNMFLFYKILVKILGKLIY